MQETQQLKKRAMVIVAHPDDAEFGVAGTVATWTRDGWEVHLVVVTDGTAGGGDEATDVGPEARRRVGETRKAEQRAAAELLGIAKVHFLDYPDGQVTPSIELRRELVRLLRSHRPSRLVTMCPDRVWEPYRIGFYHPDHLAVAEASIAALYPASQNPWDFPELLQDEGLEPHKVSELWVIGAPHSNRWLDVTPVMDLKIAALRAHDSQLGEHFDGIEEMIRGWMSQTGQRHGVAYAEEFHVAVNGRSSSEDSDAEVAAPTVSTSTADA